MFSSPVFVLNALLLLNARSVLGDDDRDNFGSCTSGDVDCGLTTLNTLLDGYLVTNDSNYNDSETDGDYDIYKNTRWEIYNFDPKPLAIIFPMGNEDVLLSIELIETFGLCYGVHSSLISHVGRANKQSVIDGCVTINFRLMNNISLYYDDSDSEYVIRVGSGTMVNDILAVLVDYCDNNDICLLYGYPLTGTLSAGGNLAGGGYGDLTRLFAPSCFQMKTVTIVTSDYDVIKAEETGDHTELLYALRGAGQTIYGLVVEVEIRLTKMVNNEASFIGGIYEYNPNDNANFIKSIRDFQLGTLNVDTTFRYEHWDLQYVNPALEKKFVRMAGFTVANYTVGQQRETDYFNSFVGLNDNGSDFTPTETSPPLGTFVLPDIGSNTIYDAVGLEDFFTVSSPGVPRYFFGLSDDDVEFLAQFFEDLIANISAANTEYGYNIGYYMTLYSRGGNTGVFDSDITEYLFPWRDSNLYEMVAYVRGPLTSFEQVEKAMELSLQASDALDAYGLNRRYTNSPSFNFEFSEYDWKDAFWGYNDDTTLYDTLAKLKCTYDSKYFFNITYPIAPDCSNNDSGDDSSSDDSDSNEDDSGAIGNGKLIGQSFMITTVFMIFRQLF